ncbi:hypothetical protein PNOK_0215800 [Pyrrhoderma noxium]|uniref:Uncharacterized protein n=1 Tax=Pyrrhoderma noxium TaxID=2282107 RepID=A0A286URJ5_9AGAM|nr:hypothetical protein PNOK_0215800 [Pyrrhoderma noxium]
MLRASAEASKKSDKIGSSKLVQLGPQSPPVNRRLMGWVNEESSKTWRAVQRQIKRLKSAVQKLLKTGHLKDYFPY